MNLSSSVLKNRAKIKLQGLYGQSVLITLIYTLCVSAVSSIGAVIPLLTGGLSEVFSFMRNGNFDPVVSAEFPIRFSLSVTPFTSIASIASILVMGPMVVGVAHYFLRVTDRNDPQLGDVFAEFKNFGNTVVLNLLIGIFTFLWSLLFIIPGVIAALRYSMAVYIMAEHPEIKPLDAIKMSKQMMQGHKGEYFVLQLSFIGWWLLCLLTCGVGVLFLSPYISAATAEFFNEVSGKNVEKMNAGVDPDGTATFFGGAGAQPAGGYDGYAQPQQGYTGSNGYQQPGQNTGYNGYAQPRQGYTGSNGYQQPGQDAGCNGYAQPRQQQPYGGYPQPDQPRSYGGYTTPEDDGNSGHTP